MFNALLSQPIGIAREMDRLFDSMIATQPLGFSPSIRSQWTYPAINVWEDDDNLYAEAELPGMKMDDIEALVTEDALTIRGCRSIDVPEEAQALRRERAMGRFSRTLQLPSPIDTEHVEAKLNHGVMTITMPKSERCKPRRINVQMSKALPTDSR